MSAFTPGILRQGLAHLLYPLSTNAAPGRCTTGFGVPRPILMSTRSHYFCRPPRRGKAHGGGTSELRRRDWDLNPLLAARRTMCGCWGGRSDGFAGASSYRLPPSSAVNVARSHPPRWRTRSASGAVRTALLDDTVSDRLEHLFREHGTHDFAHCGSRNLVDHQPEAWHLVRC